MFVIDTHLIYWVNFGKNWYVNSLLFQECLK